MHNSSHSHSRLVLTGKSHIHVFHRFLHTLIKYEHHCNFKENQGAFYMFVTQLKSSIDSEHKTKLLEEITSTTFLYMQATFMSV